MTPRQPIPPDEYRQRSLEGGEDADTRERLRDIAEYRDLLVEMAKSRDNWRWLRSGTKTFIIWLTAALAAFAALKDEIMNMFKTGGSA